MSDDAQHVPATTDTPDRPDTGAAQGVTRRRALKILGAVPMAAALGAPPIDAQQTTPPPVTKPLTPAVTGQTPSGPSATVKEGRASAKFFTAHEWRTASLLADYIIPREEHSGSATDAKVIEYMDYLLSEKDASLATQTAMHGGLAWIDTECRKRFNRSFLESSDTQRRQVLDDIAYPGKARPEMSYGVTFFSRFRDMTASGYYSSSIGWKDLQYIGNVFNPKYDGCPPAALEKLGVSYDMMKTRIAPQAK
jgi:gluconate 2-dehydrogenase gamma chain